MSDPGLSMAEVLLETHTHHRERHVDVAVIGPLQHATAAQLRDQLRRIIDTAPQPPHLVVDMRCCTGIDAHGLLTLIAARQVTVSRGGSLGLAAVPPLIHRHVEQAPAARPLLQ